MGSSSRPSKTTILRYADYLENAHERLLDSIQLYINQTVDYSESPYLSFATIDSDDAYFGSGYVLSNFPSLYDMFGKFMTGLDIDSLFSDLFESSLKIPEIDSLTNANLGLTDDNIIKDLIPQFVLSMRSLNAVVSSSFVIGKAALEERRVKLNAILSANLRYLLIPDITKRWIDSLNQKKKVIFSYALILKLQFLAKLDTDRYNSKFTVQHILWPFTVLEYERAALASLRRPVPKKSVMAKVRSTLSKSLLVASYTITGAYLGSFFGPWGTLIGGVIGFVVGLVIMLVE